MFSLPMGSVRQGGVISSPSFRCGCACHATADGNKARDIRDLGMFAIRPLNQPLIRRLVVLKLWQAHDSFDPARLTAKFVDGQAYDWDDLRQLVRRTQVVNCDKIVADCISGLAFLAALTPDEQALANDPYQRERALWRNLQADLPHGEQCKSCTDRNSRRLIAPGMPGFHTHFRSDLTVCHT